MSPSRSARLALLMLILSMACAASGMLLDWRVDALIAGSRTAAIPNDKLNRADEVATILLFLTLVVNSGVLAAFGAWVIRHHRSVLALAPIVAIPILNPVIPFAARVLDDPLTVSLAAKTAAIAAAVLAIATIRGQRPAAEPAPS